MIGRKEEVEALREAAMADRSRFVVVYGRRRVGKTFLIREAFDYRFTFSHTGMETSSMADQLESFHASLIDQGMGPCEVPIIVSVSRSTDILAIYSNCFMERLRVGLAKRYVAVIVVFLAATCVALLVFKAYGS